jgi:hypothetical protein
MTEVTRPLPAMTSHAVLVAMMEQTVAELRARDEMLRQAIAQQGPLTEMVMLATRLAEFEDTIRKATRFELTRDILQPAPAADVPRPRRPRSGSHRQRAPGEGQMKLFRVPALAAAFAAVTPHLRHARHLAHVHRLAAALTASVSATALAGTAAIIILPGGVPHSPSGAQPAFSAPAATAPAVIDPSSSPVAALAARHRGGKADSRASRVLQSAVTGAAPAQSGVSPQPQPPSSSSPPSASPGGPAQIQPSTTALDLSSGNPATITPSATGAPGSWASWNVNTFDAATGADQPDLDFSPSHGVLKAGDSVTVTVTVDPAQAEDGDASETFTVAGQSVTASLPALAPAVEPAGSGTPSPLPSVVPSVIASVEASLTA